MRAPIKLYRHRLSGHAHRVELMLSLLELPVELVDVDLARGEHRTPAFLAKSPFGQIPVIEDGDVVLADSAAILVYLALTYDGGGSLLPAEPRARAEVQRYLSVAAGPLAYGPCAARLVRILGADHDHPRAVAIAERLFTTLDSHLAPRDFFVGETVTVADVALYAYCALAPEGGISLEPYPSLRAWIARIEALPRFVPMQRTKVAS